MSLIMTLTLASDSQKGGLNAHVEAVPIQEPPWVVVPGPFILDSTLES
ncbi:MAG: hypothetical protein LBT47_01405 [Deltaproteobacteria bacterium]|nr:hypothetical protein [Deltaproteobacteria bacterium]